MKSNNLFALFCIFLMLALMIASPLLAQGEATEEPALEVPTLVEPAPPPENSQDAITDFLLKFGISSGTVVVIVAFLKRLPFLSMVSARYMNLGTNLVLIVGAVIANELGGGGQFRSILISVETILTAVLSLLTNYVGASATYKILNHYEAPILGYKRGVSTPPTGRFDG